MNDKAKNGIKLTGTIIIPASLIVAVVLGGFKATERFTTLTNRAEATEKTVEKHLDDVKNMPVETAEIKKDIGSIHEKMKEMKAASADMNRKQEAMNITQIKVQADVSSIKTTIVTVLDIVKGLKPHD